MEADIVIVGAGSAGCVLADGLSKDGRLRVLVVEAGGSDRSFWITTPMGYGKLFYDTRVNWAYRTQPDAGIAGRSDYWPRGRVIGGSSSINAMVSIRGHPADYEDWAVATGDAGWGPAAMLRAYRSFDDNEEGANEWRGVGGPLPAHGIAAEAHPLTRVFLDACAELGIPRNRDFNGADQEGAGLYQINTRHGRRVSAATAFLRPAMRRDNLEVLTQARVTGLRFDGLRCSGITILRGGRTRSIKARREVILAAGAVDSPKLLQLAGIGDGGVLAGFGIPVRFANARVGRNLQDHVGLNYFYRSRIPTLNQELAPVARRLWHGVRYLLTRSGPLALSVNQAGAFFRTSARHERPNMQLYLQLVTTLQARESSRPLLSPDPYPAFGLGVSNTRPKSRGSILISSADPLDPPAIRPNTYADTQDLEEMLDAVRFLRRLAATSALAAVSEAQLRPDPQVRSKDDLVADIRARTGSVFHPCGTCAMGRDEHDSVLDAKLRVHGVEGLRVVDASSFPNIVSGNLNIPVMMLATLASEIILESLR